jgi:hypothetical protein
MKSLIGLIAVILLLTVPVAVHANPIPSPLPVYLGTGTLTVSYSPPIGGGFYLDYDGTVVASLPGIVLPTNSVEIFCVSGENLKTSETAFDFYKFVSPVDPLFAEATWIADHYLSSSYTTLQPDLDLLKGEAQKAIWEILGIEHILGSDGVDRTIYNDAITHPDWVTENWLWALSPTRTNRDGYNNQDYLVPFSSGGDVPAPEPGTLILLGLGLTGVAVYRKFRS